MSIRREIRRYRRLRWWQPVRAEDTAEYLFHDLNHCKGRCGRHRPQRSVFRSLDERRDT